MKREFCCRINPLDRAREHSRRKAAKGGGWREPTTGKGSKTSQVNSEPEILHPWLRARARAPARSAPPVLIKIRPRVFPSHGHEK